jgi:hypothetical protein
MSDMGNGQAVAVSQLLEREISRLDKKQRPTCCRKPASGIRDEMTLVGHYLLYGKPKGQGAGLIQQHIIHGYVYFTQNGCQLRSYDIRWR